MTYPSVGGIVRAQLYSGDIISQGSWCKLQNHLKLQIVCTIYRTLPSKDLQQAKGVLYVLCACCWRAVHKTEPQLAGYITTSC